MKNEKEIKIDTKFIFSVSKEDMRKICIQQYLLKGEKDAKNCQDR